MLRSRTLVAFALVPAIPPILLAAPALLTGGMAAAAVLAFGGAISYAAAVALGIPARLCLHAWGMTRWTSYVACGVIVGVLTEIVLEMVSYLPILLADSVSFSVMRVVHEAVVPGTVFAACGALVGLALWLIERPDRVSRPTHA